MSDAHKTGYGEAIRLGFEYLLGRYPNVFAIGQGLWSPADGYYYDQLRLPDGRSFPIKAQTISGLIPLFAVAVGDADALARFSDFARRLRWYVRHRPELLHGLGDLTARGAQNRVRLALVDTDKLKLILARHAMKNAMLPVITVIGLEFAFLLGGLVVTEQVFNLNGLGLLFVEAISHRDYTLTQALVLIVAAVFIFVNFATDIAYAWLDPRIRYR